MNVDMSEAHPRVRGEQQLADEISPWLAGPSPRARGAAECKNRWAKESRTIPACAGSRLFDLETYQRQAAISMTCRETDKTDTRLILPLEADRVQANTMLRNDPPDSDGGRYG
jgi:hypothetical protein